MVESYLIRTSVNNDDIEKIREILISTESFHDFEIDTALELVEENISKGSVKSGYNFIFIENTRKKMIGYACYGPIACTLNSFDLYWIAVNKENQGKKAGKFLIEQVEMEVCKNNGRRIYIETSSKKNYKNSRNFYLKCGYINEAILKNFYDNDDHKIIFSKNLNY